MEWKPTAIQKPAFLPLADRVNSRDEFSFLVALRSRSFMPQQSVIVIDPEILGGTPCFRGTRVPVDSLIDYLEAGDSLTTSWTTFLP